MSAVSKAVEEGDTTTIEDAKQFIVDVKKKRDASFLPIAQRSWREIKKRNANDAPFGGSNMDKARKWGKFPLWWSSWKIRQPITLARLPIPVLKDTQGDDPFGRTACIVGERLTRGILKTFDAFDEFSAATDDFLITNFGWMRAFYRLEECQEDEKQRLQMVQPQPMEQVEGQPPPAPQQPIAVDDSGQPVEDYLTDEFGPYVLTGQKVTVDNEEVYLEHGLYSNLYVDPDAVKWNKVTRLAFENSYTYREFRKKFGSKTLELLSIADVRDHRTGKKPIIVYELHDKFLTEVRWFADNSSDFFQPVEMQPVAEESGENEDEEKEIAEKSRRDNSDLYGLSGFFPCTRPLIVNQSSDEFWPIPEYFQVADILEDINSIVSRMMLLTKAIRVRFLFDKSVPELKSLINETGEAGGLGVSNLAQALMNGKGTLATLVAYFPVAEMIEGLENMYKAFIQRCDMYKQATGINELLEGQTSNDVEKTYGERQLEGKFALNRIEPLQRKVQEWIKDNYQLLMELALKMFSDETLDKYITPQTLDDQDKDRYTASLELLRANKRSRFRVDFETDSTIAINEQWKKQQAVDLANTLTKAMESAAKVAEDQPELAGCELKVLTHLIGEFSDGKLFIDEIKESLEAVIEKVSQPKQPEFNKDEAKNQLDQQRFTFDQQVQAQDDKIRMMELQSKGQLGYLQVQAASQTEAAKIQSAQQIAQINAQIAQLKIQADSGVSQADLQLEVERLQADISEAQEKMSIARDALLVELRKVTDKKEVDQFDSMINARVAQFEAQLLTSQQELDKTKLILEERDKATAQIHLHQEDGINLAHGIMDVAIKHKELQAQTHETNTNLVHGALDAALKHKELVTPMEPSQAGVPSRKNMPSKSKIKSEKK